MAIKNIIEQNQNVQPNTELLKTLRLSLPQYFDSEGNFKLDKFEAELRVSNISEARDGYKLGFVGKDYARLQIGQSSETVIVPDSDHNILPENINSENVFITGDNLEALRHLQNAYTGKIKMIYIDPPYNTGKEFVYNDRFEFNDEKLKTALGYGDAEIERLKSIQGKSSHSAWLTFIYPRLILAQKLLDSDGVIFISIDDNEQANLKLLLDDIFGESNFVATIAINKASEIATENTIQKHEYVHCYAKNIEKFTVKGIPKHSISRGTVGNEDQTMPVITFPKGLRCYGIADGKYKETRKIKDSKENIENLDPIIVKNELLVEDVRMKARWRSSNDMRNFFDNNCQPTVAKINGIVEEIYFENDRFNPQIKKATFEKIPTLFLNNARGSKFLEDLNLAGYFDNPKDVNFILQILKIVTDKDSLVLDFFAGSGTTAHAVMQLNADDGGKRKYIMVQWPELTNPESEARKAGYNTIDEISRERIKRAATKITTQVEGTKLKNKGELFKNQEKQESLDKGFKHYRLIEPEVKIIDKILEFNPNEGNLFETDMVKPFSYPLTNTNGLDTILQTWLIQDGYEFNTKIEKLMLSKYEAHHVKQSAVLYLINVGFTHEALKYLLNKIGKYELIVNTIIVYPYSFSFEQMRELKNNLKNNLEQNITVIERY